VLNIKRDKLIIMEIYLKKSIINIFIDINKIMNKIMFENPKEYNKCIRELYILFLNTLNNIENIYYYKN
jgi:hypothetical protein